MTHSEVSLLCLPSKGLYIAVHVTRCGANWSNTGTDSKLNPIIINIIYLSNVVDGDVVSHLGF